MRILYSAGNRIGADTQAARILRALRVEHLVKIAGYFHNTPSHKHIDWTLDALVNPATLSNRSELSAFFNTEDIPLINLNLTEYLLEDILKFDPQLIITDAEPILSHIAVALNIPLWYCSPIHLLNGLDWMGQKLEKSLFNPWKQFLKNLPLAERQYIYSPFGDLNNPPDLFSCFDWISPYSESWKTNKTQIVSISSTTHRLSNLSKLLNSLSHPTTLISSYNEELPELKTLDIRYATGYAEEKLWFVGTGETSYLTDAMRAGWSVAITPELTDIESLLNAKMCQRYKVGQFLLPSLELNQEGPEELIEGFSKKIELEKISPQHSFLHEKVNQCIL